MQNGGAGFSAGEIATENSAHKSIAHIEVILSINE
jgi:hypothetical protein